VQIAVVVFLGTCACYGHAVHDAYLGEHLIPHVGLDGGVGCAVGQRVEVEDEGTGMSGYSRAQQQ
jgi:hypothetical protein